MERYVGVILFKIDVLVLGVFFNVIMVILNRRRFIEIFFLSGYWDRVVECCNLYVFILFGDLCEGDGKGKGICYF